MAIGIYYLVAMTLSEAVKMFDQYKRFEVKGITLARYRNDLRLLTLSLKNIDIREITREMIMKEIQTMDELGWDRKSLFQKLSAYRRFFTFLQKHGYQSLNPDHIPKVKLEFVEPRVLSEEEYQKILSVIKEKGLFGLRNKAMIKILWDTGVRIGELVAFNISELPTESEGGVWKMTIKTEKTRGKRPMRQIYWSDETNTLLHRWIDFRAEYAKEHKLKDPDALFIAMHNGQGRRLTLQAPEDMLVRYSRAAGIPTANPHSFRHAKARRIIEMGGSNSDVMNILGHSSLASSEIYTSMFGDRLKERAAKFL